MPPVDLSLKPPQTVSPERQERSTFRTKRLLPPGNWQKNIKYSLGGSINSRNDEQTRRIEADHEADDFLAESLRKHY